MKDTSKKAFTLKTLTKSNVWDIQENDIFRMSGLSIIISIIGIIIFIGLTAYDAQKIKASYAAYENDPAMLNKVSVNLALQLYLDFINLFIYILRLMGKARR